jgi:hypothetical protein
MPGTTKRAGVAVVADYARATGTLLPIKPGSEPAGKVPRGIAEQLGLRSSEERGKLGASEPEVEKLNNNLVVLHDVPCIHVLIVRGSLIVNPNILMVESVQLSWPTEGRNFSKKGGSFGL